MKKLLLSIFILLVYSSFGFDMQAYVNQHKNQNLQVFLDNFPYNQYLETVAFTDFPRIQEDRYIVWKNIKDANGRQDGDIFLYRLADEFLKQYPVTLAQLSKKIAIGEAYLSPTKKLSNPSQPYLDKNHFFKLNTNEAYQIVGYYILSKVAETIEKEHRKNKFNQNDSLNITYLKRLKNNKVLVSFEESSTKKIIANIKQGKFDYVIDRFQQSIKSFICGLGIFIWLIVVALVGIIFANIPLLFKKISVGLAIVLVILKFTTDCNPSPVSSSARPNFKQIWLKSFYKTGYKSEHLVEIFNLKDKNSNRSIGHSVWMRAPRIKVQYFASSAVNQFRSFKNQQHVVLATTGGYTTNFGGSKKPDGFTLENGKLINAVLLHDRHGLAVFSNNSVQAINLKANKIKLPNGDILDSPFESLAAYSQLLKWCKENQATVFQTHLLASNDSILINPSKSSNAQRERRLLALFQDKKGNKVHAIFNITSSYDLASITQEIFNIIAKREFKVLGIMNLDTGSYDILNVFNERGNLWPTVRGPVDISVATNLIVYYK